MTQHRSGKQPFRPRARLLTLLGEQLIRDSKLAVFELVKNGYDADASNVTVKMFDINNRENATIVVEDDGTGMDFETVTGVWLEPGTDFRDKQKQALQRSPKYGRLPLGEKGLGRFAVHKLGESITLVTRKKGKPEVTAVLDWDQLSSERYLDSTSITVEEREPEVFINKTGTRIEISGLKENWNKKMVRDLHRAVNSIASPFEGPDDFETSLQLEPDPEGWLDGLLDVRSYLDVAPFWAECTIDGNRISGKYGFSPPKGLKQFKNRDLVEIDLVSAKHDLSKFRIGPVQVNLSMYDLDSQVLEFAVSDKKGLKDFLNANGGVRVYRDGIRVYDYGEPGNDWLDLDGRRINIPTERLSNNLVIGSVSLNLRESKDLVEKTNREGFVENAAYFALRDAVVHALSQFEAERTKDKQKLRLTYAKAKKQPVIEELAILRSKLQDTGLLDELGPILDRIDRQFKDVKDRLLTAAGSGLSLAVVIHEVEKAIGTIVSAIESDTPMAQLKVLASHLEELVDGLTFLARKSGMSTEAASVIIKHAVFNMSYRLKAHKINLINGYGENGSDFKYKVSRRLLISTLMNLVDNAIYWLESQPDDAKTVFIGTSVLSDGRQAIIVGDNGPGFIDEPEFLVQPFFSRKSDGMGLGLHLASEVMKMHNGSLEFLRPDEIRLPEGIDGAIIALAFGEPK